VPILATTDKEQVFKLEPASGYTSKELDKYEIEWKLTLKNLTPNKTGTIVEGDGDKATDTSQKA